MLRTSTGLVLALVLLVLPSAAHAEEDAPPAHADHEHEPTAKLVVYDVSDVAERIPDLTNRLKPLLPHAQIKRVRRPAVLIVNATKGEHEDLGLLLGALRRDLFAPGDGVAPEAVVQRALERADANAATLAGLRTRRVSLQVEDMPGRQVLQLLAASTGTNLVLSPQAFVRLENHELTLETHEAKARLALDLVLEPAGLRLLLDGGIVRILAPDELDATSIRLDPLEPPVVSGSTARETPSEEAREEAARGDGAAKEEPADLETLVRALHDEVRALREEVREVRAILEELRER